MPTVYDYFQRASRRDPAILRGSAGRKVIDSEGNAAAFWVQSESGRVLSIQYKCTTCFTLVALCEHLAELVVGMSLSEARQYAAEDLLSLHPEVPSMRHDRAELAIQALQSALDQNTQE